MKPDPRFCAWLIARNEERDLPRALRSLAGVADHIVVVDTGSTDRTEVVAMTTIDIPTTCERYLDASEPDPARPGEYRIVDFAKARNRAVELAERTGCSHLLGLDCDDVIETPLAIRRAAYLPNSVYGVWNALDYTGQRQIHYRIWRADLRLRYHGWVHEYLKIPAGVVAPVLNDCCIRHYAQPHESAGEDSNARNLRILLKQWQAEPDARCAFYLANTHKDANRFAEACSWYYKRLGFGMDGFRDEFLFSLLYLARCHRALGEIDAAASACEYGLALAPQWQEYRMELAFIAFHGKQYVGAIEQASRALRQEAPPTVLWRETSMYRDQPARLISWSHEMLGDVAQARVWGERATDLIDGDDADWQLRQRRLAAQEAAAIEAPAVITKPARRRVALHRPGAIGDVLMTLNLMPAFRAAHPDAEIHYYTHASLCDLDALGSTILAAGADMVMDCAGLPAWRKSYDRVYDLIGYPLHEGYPEKPMRRHLLEYFGQELGLDTLSWGGLPQLLLPMPKRLRVAPVPTDPYITLQMRAGWSRYKEWPFDRWHAAMAQIRGEFDAPIAVIDEGTTPRLCDALALIANATLHVGVDSFANHLTNYLWQTAGRIRRVPGVILWGSTQWEAAGYPDNVNIAHRPPCGPCFRETHPGSLHPRGPCIDLVETRALHMSAQPPSGWEASDWTHKCMADISVDEVVGAVRSQWAKAAQATEAA